MANILLDGASIHGFHTLEGLNIPLINKRASKRWLEPNEILAILHNRKYLVIDSRAKDFPPSGTIVLFNRTILKHFRSDGHNWKKKRNGKGVEEGHSLLRVGDGPMIHGYYAQGEDRPTFYRRCYWLCDKKMHDVVLVHYLDTQKGSPVPPMNPLSGSISDPTTLRLLPQFDSSPCHAPIFDGNEFQVSEVEIVSEIEIRSTGTEPSEKLTEQEHETRLRELNQCDLINVNGTSLW